MDITYKRIEEISRIFQIQGEFRSFEQITNGHINTTYRVYFFRDGEMKNYILQRLNTYVFQSCVDLMENIITVSEHIRTRIKSTGVTAKKRVLHYQQTADGKYYTITENGEFWRCCRYIDGSATFLKAETPFVMEEAGKAFGEFQMFLSDYPVQDLHIIIPHFHNTIMRYETFKKALEADVESRAEEVKETVAEYLELEDIATQMYKKQKRGELPLRVTHNDTKCSNVLFDQNTFEHLAVIDLDTVMPGLVAFDFGDAIRAGANAAAEDERDLSKVYLDMEKYEAFTKGFLGLVKDSLTDNEKETLALGALTMTIECGVRFLTDYLDGDKYFKIEYPTHNLVRAKCQLQLAKDMLLCLDEMNEIVKKHCE